MSPFFTILTTTYNRKDLFKSTFQSMISQSFRDFEILVVDDGSSDGTLELLDTLAEKHSQVRIIKQPNRERGAARNTGIRNALGTYIVMVDSDDLIDSKHLQLIYENIQRLNKPNFIGTKFDFIRNGKSYVAPISRLKEGFYDHKILLHGNVFGIVFAIRRENPKLKLYEEDRSYSILEDWMFNFVNFKESPIYLINATTYHIIDHMDRSMRAENQKIISRKKLATDWIINHVTLSQKDRNSLQGFTNYFCAIHSHLDYKDKEALSYLKYCIQKNGIKASYLFLGLKCILGRKNIDRITSLIGYS